MKATLKINLNNEAFVENRNEEVKRILLDFINRIDNGYDIFYLQDINGNNVGEFKFIK